MAKIEYRCTARGLNSSYDFDTLEAAENEAKGTSMGSRYAYEVTCFDGMNEEVVSVWMDGERYTRTA